MAIRRKSNVQFHSDGFREDRPAINVKCYHFANGLNVARVFNCHEDDAARALSYAWDSSIDQFWEQAQTIVQEIFDHEAVYDQVKVFSGGRSGGWLIVEGLPSFDSWDAIQLGKWSRFEKRIRELIGHLSSTEYVKDMIESNRWAEAGSEPYNFVDGKEGTTCIVDLKNQAVEVGLGAVVRSPVPS
jgi:hypothetical protein